MRVVVTGALGFIGHHLYIGLAGKEYKVLGIDNLSRGKRERIDLPRNHGVNVVLADIRDPSNIIEDISRIQTRDCNVLSSTN